MIVAPGLGAARITVNGPIRPVSPAALPVPPPGYHQAQAQGMGQAVVSAGGRPQAFGGFGGRPFGLTSQAAISGLPMMAPLINPWAGFQSSTFISFTSFFTPPSWSLVIDWSLYLFKCIYSSDARSEPMRHPRR